MTTSILHDNIKAHKPIHLIGIGGVSMSALAELLLSMGVSVSGSDREESPITQKLLDKGAVIFYGHAEENLPNRCLVIRTSAIHEDNQEVQKARRLGLPILERAEAWGELMRDYQNVICLAGTHGKTTSTSMMTHITMAAALDPTVMVGTVLDSIGGTLRIGGKGLFVAESCEYCNSFLNFPPTVSVILNIEADHLDFFKDLADIQQSFRQFALNTPEKGGLVVANFDDAAVRETVADLPRRVIGFGVCDDAQIRAKDIVIKNGYYSFAIYADEVLYTTVSLSVPGAHNMQNALACAAAAYGLGIDGEAVARGLALFTGSSRRFQKIGELNGAMIVDDYAHHPGEITPTLTMAKSMDFKRVIVAFQSHTYTRTHALFDDFAKALSIADLAIIADVYSAREQNTVGVNGEKLAAAISGGEYYDSFEKIAQRLRGLAREGDLILTMGAGDIFKVGKMLLSTL